MRSPFVTRLAFATLQTVAPASAQTYDRRYPVCMDVFGPGAEAAVISTAPSPGSRDPQCDFQGES